MWNRTFDNKGESALAVIETQDNAVVTILSYGDINKLDSNGNLLWNKKTGIISDYWSAARTRDGGYFFGGSYYLKTDGGGNIVWQKNLLNNSRSTYFRISVTEINESQYLAGNFIKSWDHEDIVNVARIDSTGAFVKSPELTSYGALVQFPFFTVQKGTLVFFSNRQNSTHPVRVVALDQEGDITTEKELSASTAVIPTKDHGYFSADTDNFRLHLVKLDPDGIITWDKKLRLDFSPRPDNYVIKVVQSSDDSYVILYTKTEQSDLSK